MGIETRMQTVPPPPPPGTQTLLGDLRFDRRDSDMRGDPRETLDRAWGCRQSPPSGAMISRFTLP